MNLNKLEEFMKLKHGNQKRKQGTPYYLHPLAVAKMLKEKGFSEDYQIAGLFHDLMEDTDATCEEIKNISNENIVEAVKLLTKTKRYVMSEYIGNIEKNDIAKMVKLADRIHNLSEAIFASKEFQKKYIKETEEWFINLAKNTVFENDLKYVLNKVKMNLENN